jgi:hypothetical protein
MKCLQLFSEHPAGGLALLRKILPAMALLLFAGTASATTFTASGTAGGQTIDAQAVFTFNNLTPDVMTVTLTNLLPNPKDVGQNITDFDFQLLNSLGQTITPTCTTNCLTSASATSGLVSIGSGGTPVFPSPNPAVDPGWAVSLTSGTFLLNGLGGTHNPRYSIIGPPGSGGTYSNANGSLTNGSHDPFINQTATWTFTFASLPVGVTVGHVVFSFNTSSGDNFSCDTDPNGCGGGGGGQSTPEPLSFVLAGSGLIGIYFIRRRRGSS